MSIFCFKYSNASSTELIITNKSRSDFDITLFSINLSQSINPSQKSLPNKIIGIFLVIFFVCSYKKVLYLSSRFSGRSVARLSRRVWDAEVAGSNPATPTDHFFKWSHSSAGQSTCLLSRRSQVRILVRSQIDSTIKKTPSLLARFF